MVRDQAVLLEVELEIRPERPDQQKLSVNALTSDIVDSSLGRGEQPSRLQLRAVHSSTDPSPCVRDRRRPEHESMTGKAERSLTFVPAATK